MTVYIEYVFIDNFIIDALILKTACKIADKNISLKKIIFCSLLGAVFALVFPLIVKLRVIAAFVKVLFGLFLAFIAGKFVSVKQYIDFSLIFFAVTFLFGGGAFGFCYLIGIEPSSEISVGLTVLPVAVLYFTVEKIVRYFFRKRDIKNFCADAVICFGDKKVRLKGLLDTGNGLYDGLSPVIVVNINALLPVISKKEISSAKRIDISTVNGISKKISVKPTAVEIYYGDKRNIFNNVTVCMTDKKFDGYDLLLHPALIKNSEENVRPKITEMG